MLAASNEVLVMGDSKAPPDSLLNRVNLDTGAVTPIPLNGSIGSATGGTIFNGQVFVATFGNFSIGIPSGILQLDVYTGAWHWILNNFFGLAYNGRSWLYLKSH